MSVNSTDSLERKCRKNVDGSTSARLAMSVTVTLSNPRSANKSSAERVSTERVRCPLRPRRPIGCLVADSSTLTHRILSGHPNLSTRYAAALRTDNTSDWYYHVRRVILCRTVASLDGATSSDDGEPCSPVIPTTGTHPQTKALEALMSSPTITNLASVTGSWILDPSRTVIRFQTSILRVIKVNGTFSALEGWACVDPNGALTGSAVIDATSIDTKIAKR